MEPKTLEELQTQYRREVLGEESPESREVLRFRDFLVRHGGLRRVERPGEGDVLVDRAEALRCYHFSQYLDWYLTEKAGASRGEIEDARLAMGHLNEWLLERQAITHETFEENRESILSGEAGPAAYEDLSGEAAEDEAQGPSGVPEEKDFHVPGEYSATLSGELILTKVQEGILYGRLPEGGKEIGPILVDRAVSSGHQVGDRVHLSLGRAGDHWNLLSFTSRHS